VKQQRLTAMPVYERVAGACERLTANERASLKSLVKTHASGDGGLATSARRGWAIVPKRVSR
jgi:hypothetical protein